MKSQSLAFLLLIAGGSAACAATTLTPTTRGRVSFKGNKSAPSEYLTSTSGTSGLPVGDSSDNTTVHAGLYNFTVSGQTVAIAAASQILFLVTPTNSSGTAPDIRLVAFTTDVNSIPSTASTAAGTIVATLSASSISIGSPVSFDVTSYVKADALAGNFSSFRLESVMDASNGGTADFFTFGTIDTNDARLEIIPEPGFPALLGVTGALVLLRKRRHA